jgi:hypothetical protein
MTGNRDVVVLLISAVKTRVQYFVANSKQTAEESKNVGVSYLLTSDNVNDSAYYL